MLLSMTGIGEARLQNDRFAVSAEIRTVNNRHFKLSARISEPFGVLEPEFERLIRETVRRGTVQFNLRIDRPRRTEDYRLNLVALSSYRDQIQAWLGSRTALPELTALLQLPGIVEEIPSGWEDPREDWPVLADVVTKALAQLQMSRTEEGRAMSEELLRLGRSCQAELEKIAERGPAVVVSYRDRLQDRVQNLLNNQGVTVRPEDLIREVALFAERGDIAEELTRLRAHLDQFFTTIAAPDSAGRKLEFVVQEMGRETNTIGSKANDIEISRAVIEIKGHLERIRELIQNVE